MEFFIYTLRKNGRTFYGTNDHDDAIRTARARAKLYNCIIAINDNRPRYKRPWATMLCYPDD